MIFFWCADHGRGGLREEGGCSHVFSWGHPSDTELAALDSSSGERRVAFMAVVPGGPAERYPEHSHSILLTAVSSIPFE
jgi:hypothetical protein